MYTSIQRLTLNSCSSKKKRKTIATLTNFNLWNQKIHVCVCVSQEEYFPNTKYLIRTFHVLKKLWLRGEKNPTTKKHTSFSHREAALWLGSGLVSRVVPNSLHSGHPLHLLYSWQLIKFKNSSTKIPSVQLASTTRWDTRDPLVNCDENIQPSSLS